jgi:cytidyltransferase-like protein
MKRVAVTGSFDDLRSHDFRFLEEAARFGELRVALWSNETVRDLEGRTPKFSEAERRYLLQSVRHVSAVDLVNGRVHRDSLPSSCGPAGVAPPTAVPPPDVWVVKEEDDTAVKREWCRSRGIEYRVLGREELRRFPDPARGLRKARSPEKASASEADRERGDEGGSVKFGGPRKVVVTGCYDWFHSGHVRFFEEVAEHGALYVGVGSDENIRLLKGEGHPMFPARERRYIVECIRYVEQAFIPTGTGWLDAEGEILELRPDYYAVNEDGDKPEKRRFCMEHGIGYLVLKRLPREGLPRRESTALRGF